VIEAGSESNRDMPSLQFITAKPDGFTKKAWAEELHITIAHECIHMAFDCLQIAGVKVGPKNHEALAYLHSFLQREIIRLLGVYQKEIKK
jgi:hypothetical protein